MSSSLKRKPRNGSKSSRKKAKSQATAAVDVLPWKSVSHYRTAGELDDDDGILELEEVENVQVVYEDSAEGRVAKFKVLDTKGPEERGQSSGSEDTEVELEAPPEELFDSKTLLPHWHELDLHPQLLRSLHNQSFTKPTPIQLKAIPHAMKKRDVIGVAETGSGKTLAYGLPILHQLLSQAKLSRPGKKVRRKLSALILTPTRELALQVSSHLHACLGTPDIKIEDDDETPLSKSKAGSGQKIPRPPPAISVAAVVGGLSAQKQRRILTRGVDILVATPGRLWDILQEDNSLAEDIKSLNFLILDEADRMVETGHFAELDNILRLTLKQKIEDFGDSEPLDDEKEHPDGMQTFVFSATLSKDLQRNLKRHQRPGKGRKSSKPASTLDDLVMRLDFRDPEPEIIDLSPEGGVVSSLQESQVECLSADKDTYLYYFLLRYPGRSLVFLSSIDGIRRLTPLLELLDINTFPLHSQLEQKQRLKNLDRFKSSANSVLLATDIAARGLDVPSVDHVIHYQIPRSADVYVHRNGRTARAMRSGFSLIMCAPDERKIVRALLNSLGRKENEIPDMGIDLHMLDKLKARTQLARQIDSAQHKIKKENHERNWLKEAAEAMEIELDSDLVSEAEDRPSAQTKRERKSANTKTAALKQNLKAMLAQPLIAKGISTRYITSGSKSIADELLAGKGHETMLGLRKTDAGGDLAPTKRKKNNVEEKPEEYDEWDGFKIE